MEWFKHHLVASFEHIGSDKNALKLLVKAQTPATHHDFNTYTWDLLPIPPPHRTPSAKTEWEAKFLGILLGFCGKHQEVVPPTLSAAITNRKQIRGVHKQNRHRFVIVTGIHPRAMSICPPPAVQVIQVRRLRKLYPPRGYWVCETEEILNIWEDHLETCKLADRRYKRKPCHLLKLEELQVDVGPDDSVFFYDKQGNFIGGVIRHVSGDPRAAPWGNRIVRYTSDTKKSVRLDDRGKLSLVGYTAGAISCPEFHWAKNGIGPARSAEAKSAADQDSSAVFAFFWNMCRQRLPPTVMEVFDRFFRTHNIRHMDGNGTMLAQDSESHGKYCIQLGDGFSMEFRNVELAPPSGAVGYNYARPIHSESSPVPWAMSWTTSRTDDPLGGGSFFMSKYGIRIAGATDSLIVWNPEQPHGTGLQRYKPGDDDPDFIQAGACMFVPNRLPKVWNAYRQKQVTHAQATQMLEEAAEDSIQY